MPFPSRLILSSVAISVSLSGKMEKLLLARLMQVKYSISPTISGSLVSRFPRRSSSERYLKTGVNQRVSSLSVLPPTFVKWTQEWVHESKSWKVWSTTSQQREGCKESAGNALHHIVSHCDNADVVWDTREELKHTIWEGNELAVWQICREEWEDDYELMKLECSFYNDTFGDLKLFDKTNVNLCHHLLVKIWKNINPNNESGLFSYSAEKVSEWEEGILPSASFPSSMVALIIRTTLATASAIYLL